MRNILLAILKPWGFVMSLACVVVMAAAFASPGLCEMDQNRDGSVDVVDAQVIVGLILGDLSPVHFQQGDVDGDGLVDVVDVQLTVAEILGIASPLTLRSSARLPGARVGVPYSYQLAASGGVKPLAWTYIGDLPPGLTLTSDGLVSGTPTALGGNGVVFEVVDAIGTRLSLTAQIGVWSGYAAPITADDITLVPINTIASMAAPGVLGNDSCPIGSGLRAMVLIQPSVGVLDFESDGSFAYTAPMGHSALVTFVYRVFNDVGGFADATVSIAIANAAPMVGTDLYVTGNDQTLDVPLPGVLINDSDPENGTLTATVETYPTHGLLTMGLGGSFTYSPLSSYVGFDSFTYRATDPNGAWSIGLVRIRVMPPGMFQEVGVKVEVTPNPIRAGDPMTITVDVDNTWSLLPGFDFVRRVFIGSPQLGLSADVTLPKVSEVSATSSRYVTMLTPPASILPYGLQSVNVSVVSEDGTVTVGRGRFVVYFGGAVHVGPGQMYSTIQDGILNVTPRGAVLIHPGVYTGIGNRNMTGAGAVIAGINGRAVTTIDVQNSGSAVALFTSINGDTHGLNDDTIFMGLTVINASVSAFGIRVAPRFFRVDVTNCHNIEGNGGAVNVHAINVPPLGYIVECNFMGNSAGIFTLASPTSARGGALNISSADILECTFINNTVRGRNNAEAGAIYMGTNLQFHVGPPPVIENCRFEGNKADAGSTASGGAMIIFAAFIRHCSFANNRATARVILTPPPNSIVASGARAIGGAGLIGSCTVFDCLFQGNGAESQGESHGGAISLFRCSPTTFDQCTFHNNFAFSEGLARGGALGNQSGITALRLDHCKFYNNSALTSSATGGDGGAIFMESENTSALSFPPPGYFAVFNCLIFDNIVGATSSGASAITMVRQVPSTTHPISTFEMRATTITDNVGGAYAVKCGPGHSILSSNIVADNTASVSVFFQAPPAVITTVNTSVTHCNLRPASIPLFAGSNGNINADPLFATRPGMGDYFLSQSPAQTIQSPCVNAGDGGYTSPVDILGTTTATDLFLDVGGVDMGYHYFRPRSPIVPRIPFDFIQFGNMHPCEPPEPQGLANEASNMAPGATTSSGTSTATSTPSATGSSPGTTASGSSAISGAPNSNCGCASRSIATAP